MKKTIICIQPHIRNIEIYEDNTKENLIVQSSWQDWNSDLTKKLFKMN